MTPLSSESNMTIIDKYNEHNAFGRLLDMHFKVLSPGVTEYHLKIKAEHLATPHAAHGGLIGALTDASLGTAALSAVEINQQVVSTIEYKLNFLSPAFEGDELVAIGKVESQGKRILVVTCEVLCQNRDHKLIAKAMGTFNAYDAAKAGL